MFSLESSHRGDSNEYTQHTIINKKRKSPEIIPNIIMSAAVRFFFFVRDSKMSSKIAVVNEESGFEPLKFYCKFHLKHIKISH